MEASEDAILLRVSWYAEGCGRIAKGPRTGMLFGPPMCFGCVVFLLILLLLVLLLLLLCRVIVLVGVVLSLRRHRRRCCCCCTDVMLYGYHQRTTAQRVICLHSCPRLFVYESPLGRRLRSQSPIYFSAVNYSPATLHPSGKQSSLHRGI